MKSSYKWILLALLGGAYFFHQADRALFGVLTLPIQEELHLTDVQIGWINTTLSWTLALMSVVAGFLGDRVSRKWIITLSLIAWSLVTMCMGFVRGFVDTLFFRSIATGVGESFFSPSAYAMIATYHVRTRSIALSIIQAALYVGLMSSGVLVAWMLGFLDTWRNVFIVFGCAGVLLGISFIWLLKEKPNEGRSDAASPREGEDTTVTVSSAPAVTWREACKAYFCNPSALCVTAGFVAIVFVNNAYLFWAPKFAAQKFAIDVGKAGTGVMLWHHLFALGAILLGGIITDRLVMRWPRFRLGFQIVALLGGAPMLLWMGFAPSFTGMLVAASGYGIFRGLFEVNTYASLFDVLPARFRSTAVGLQVLIAFLFGGLSGVMMGALAQKHGVAGFELGFGLMAGAYALAAVVMMFSFFVTFRKYRVIE